MRIGIRVLSGVGACLGLGIGTLYLKASPVDAYTGFQDRSYVDCPYFKWDYNWDNFQRFKVTKEGKQQDSSKDSKFSRTIWLVNEVQHNRSKNDLEQTPTTVGILQGRLCAATLSKLKIAGLKWDAVYYSTMLRTAFQAELMRKVLTEKDVIWKSTELLVEGMPVEVSPKAPDIPDGREYSKFYYEDHPRIEAAFRTIFYRPNQEQRKNTNDLVITHSNVIRYFICRALQMPPEAFSRFTLNHASLTKIRIEGNGFVTVEGIGDAGYLPPTVLTSGEVGGEPPVIVDPDISRLIYREGFNFDSNVPEVEFQKLLGAFEEQAKAAKMVSS